MGCFGDSIVFRVNWSVVLYVGSLHGEVVKMKEATKTILVPGSKEAEGSSVHAADSISPALTGIPVEGVALGFTLFFVLAGFWFYRTVFLALTSLWFYM